MAFTVIMQDSSGRKFFDGSGGMGYHYWGTVDFTMVRGTNTVGLFGIPSSVPICCFTYMNRAEDLSLANPQVGGIDVYPSGGVWVASHFMRHRFSWNDGSISVPCKILVFVPAYVVRSQSHTLHVFDAGGTKVLDMSRPVLQLCGHISGGSTPSGTGVYRQPIRTYYRSVPNNVALAYANNKCGVLGDCRIYPISSQPDYNLLYQVACRYFGGPTGYGFSCMGTQYAMGASFLLTAPSQQPMVDVDYYAQFGNVGWW